MEGLLNDVSKREVALWRKYPGYAATRLLHNPLGREEKDETYTMVPIQRVVANKAWDARSAVIVACRGWGKTRMAATLAILKAWLWPGRRVGCLSASFRQAKQIFEEIEKIWNRSPLLQQCTTRNPSMSNDMCRLDFKPVPGREPSTIRALPLADGAKIRGQRFHTIFVDECVHVPEDVFNTVIRPMAATHQDPVRAMRIGLDKDKIWSNKDLTDEEKLAQIRELESFVGANQIIMLTSGYYSFNYVYKLYSLWSDAMHGKFNEEDIDLYEEMIRGEDDDVRYEEADDPSFYAAFQVPYWAIPKNFLDSRSLKRAKIEMSPLQFRMEYEAAWIIDTGGWFKPVDIGACRANQLRLLDHNIQLEGTVGKQYFLTIDPARTSDAFAMVVSEWDPSFGIKIVYAEQFFGQEAHTQKMVNRIHELSNPNTGFNVVQIGMDKGGGGLQIADFLSEPPLNGQEPIYDIDNQNYRGLRGRHILKVVDFNSMWIEGAHNKAYNLLQRRQISFPNSKLESTEKSGEKGNKELERYRDVHLTIEKMINQIISIQPSETRTGRIHFDLPDKGSAFEKHKDLYSAWLIACDMGYDFIQSSIMPVRKMPLMGIITPRGSYGMW
jgi:hypothetical protein